MRYFLYRESHYLYLAFILIVAVPINAQKVGSALEWIVTDKEVNRDFIEEYQDKLLTEFPEIEELPTTDHFIIVSVDYSKEGADSVLFQSTDLENIIYALKTEVIAKIDSNIVQKLMKRRYSWDHLDWKTHDIRGRNVYKEIDRKKIRDYFWWTHNLLEVSPAFSYNSFKLRPDPGLLSLMFNQGFEELGYLGALSRNSSFLLTTEATQLVVYVPTPPLTLSLGKVEPLEISKGIGFKFDVNRIGGVISYQTIDGIDRGKFSNPEHTVYLNWSGVLYWSSAFLAAAEIPGQISKTIAPRRRLIPPGIQRVKGGIAYARLNYVQFDSLGNYELLDHTDFSESLSFFLRLEYISNPEKDHRSYGEYSKFAGYVQINYLQGLNISSQLMWSYSPGLQFGVVVVYARDVIFNSGLDTEYIWSPGFAVGPNFILRW